MTKLRPPVSEGQALDRIAGVLEWSGMAKLLGKAERTVRNWGEPDTTAGISYRDALALDVAYQLKGGQGAPLYDCYALRLNMAQAVMNADAEALSRAAKAAAKEGGEAVAALIEASRPGATAADRLIAKREVQESIEVLASTLPMLEQPSEKSGLGVPPRSPPSS